MKILVLHEPLPCSLGAIVYDEEIIRLIYERGAFDPNATGVTSMYFAAIGIVINIAVNFVLNAARRHGNPVYMVVFGDTACRASALLAFSESIQNRRNKVYV